MGHPSGNALVRLQSTFEEHQLVTVHDGKQPLWLALELSAALGYAERDRIARSIRTDWSDQLAEAVDFRMASPVELRALKDAGVVQKNARHIMLLTESGVYAVALLSRQPAATRLRQWLSREVLPQIRATGRYDASPSEAGPMVDEDAVRARVLVELHADGVLDDRALVGRLDDEQIAGLPGAVLGPMVRRLAEGAPAAAPARPQVAPAGFVAVPRPAGRSSDSGRSSGNLVALLVDWAKKHPQRVVQGEPTSKHSPPGGWEGRWLEARSRLALTGSRADAVFAEAGLTPSVCRRQLRDSGFLIVPECELRGGHQTFTAPISFGGFQKSRCLVFEVRHGG